MILNRNGEEKPGTGSRSHVTSSKRNSADKGEKRSSFYPLPQIIAYNGVNKSFFTVKIVFLTLFVMVPCLLCT